jgi:hypothetical protein
VTRRTQDIRKGTKIKIVETLVFPAVTYGSESWTVRKKGSEKYIRFRIVGMEKTVQNPMDSEENKSISRGIYMICGRGGGKTKTTGSNDHPTKVTIFRSL